MQTIPLIIVASYLIGMLIVGFVVGKLKIKNSQDYMVAGRRMGLFMVAFSLSANNIGGGSTTGLAAKAFGTWGMSAVWYVLTASIAMIPLAYFAPKIRKTMAVTTLRSSAAASANSPAISRQSSTFWRCSA